MKLLASFSLSRNHVNSRWLASLCIVESVLLSALHHRFNFWGWPWDKQVLIILIVAPGLAYVLQLLLAPVWKEVTRIRLWRWTVFLLPALGIAALAASQFLVMPETQHHLEVIPSVGDAAGDLQVQEIKAAYGNNVPLSTFAHLPGWTLQGGVLVSRNASTQPLNWTFAGPIGQQVRVTFLSSPHSGQARVILDGQKADLALAGSEGNQRRARLDTQYRWGVFNFLIVPIILASDVLTVVCLLAVLWLIQEITQDRRTVSDAASAERFLSHRDGLLLICGLGLVLHAVHFLTIPLVVLKDSPSYLQGAVFWIQHHSLDGVSSYRGPGTTFLFSPFMAPFGRNPWGLKVLLHLLAFGCIPLTYRLGWQLGRRRWFAFTVGLLTALLPDLYVYSSYVLSEAPDVFFALLYCTLLISALETLSPSWIVAAVLAGSFTVLVRSENLAALVIGLAFLLMRFLWLHRTAALPSAGAEGGQTGSSAKLWHFALAVLVAGLPLLAWSMHNQKTFGFFGISDYAGEILYDGWIYYGESSRLAITKQDSPAVQAINAAYQPRSAPGSGVATGWEIYYSLRARGYTSEESFGLLERAALDSIRNDLWLTGRVLLIKIRNGFEPNPFIPGTFPLPGQPPEAANLNAAYFNQEPLLIPALVPLQQYVNALLVTWYRGIFTVWFWLGLVMLFIALYRRPPFAWIPLAAIVANSIFLPTIVGMSMWRYVLFGLVLMPIFILSGVQSLGEFIPHYWYAFRKGMLSPE